jgi:hypothetical protein
MDGNPYESPQVLEPQSSAQPAQPSSRLWLMTFLSLTIHPFALVAHMCLICGCHFHWPALAVALVPITWGFATLFIYRSQEERLLSYFNVLLAFGWLWLDWGANTNFYFY